MEKTYHSMSEEKKRRLKQNQENYCKAKKLQYNNEWNSFVILISIVIHIIINEIVF